MSSARILAQANPALLNAFPGWKAPTHLRCVVSIGAAGAVTDVPDHSTPGVTITQVGSGVYALNFPPCRHIAEVSGEVAPATAGTVANHRKVSFAFTAGGDTNAQAGLLGMTMVSFANPPAITDPNNGSVLDVSFWADLG